MAKKTDKDIDEDFIMASMNMTGPSTLNKTRPTIPSASQSEPEKQEEQEEPEHLPPHSVVTEEKETKKKKNKETYESLFIRQADIAGRQEKTVYLREKYYERIEKVVKLYNNPRLSVFSYVDAVLELHFETYKQDIKEVHDKLYTAPYE